MIRKAKALPELDIISELSRAVTEITGIQLGDRQHAMVSSRLKRRISELYLADEIQYMEYFRDHREQELQALVSLLTTHHTFFFREMIHFEYLEQKGLASLVTAARLRGDSTIRIWSAACSRGQEVYSLAMFLNYHLKQIAPDITFEILGSDVDPQSVAYASNGVYPYDDLKSSPSIYLAENWVKGSGEIEKFAKVKMHLKEKCHFSVINLINIPKGIEGKAFDLIFCRNVFIYFSSAQITLITKCLIKSLRPGGQLVVGISESLNGLDLDLASLGPSIYVPSKFKHLPSEAAARAIRPRSPEAIQFPAPIPVAMPLAPTSEAELLKVFCVDDSPSILALLEKILTKENGYEIVQTASNGKDAIRKLKLTRCDLVTLDIHMPEMNGLEYMQRHFGADHPPVVIISSISREESEIALKAFAAGVSDYIEKPTSSNLIDKSEEICSKLRCAYKNRRRLGVSASSLDHAFQKRTVIKNPENKLRIFSLNFGDRRRLKDLFRTLDNTQPPSVILFDGSALEGEQAAQVLSKEWGRKVEHLGATNFVPKIGGIYIADDKIMWDMLHNKYHSNSGVCILVLGEPSKKTVRKIRAWKGRTVLVEESDEIKKRADIIAIATDIIPLTSFVYNSLLELEK